MARVNLLIEWVPPLPDLVETLSAKKDTETVTEAGQDSEWSGGSAFERRLPVESALPLSFLHSSSFLPPPPPPLPSSGAEHLLDQVTGDGVQKEAQQQKEQQHPQCLQDQPTVVVPDEVTNGLQGVHKPHETRVRPTSPNDHHHEGLAMGK